MPVPDSGVPGGDRLPPGNAAFRSSSASSAPTMSGAPSSSRPGRPPRRRQAQAQRQRALIEGKKIVLIDDFIVRGTTSRQDRPDDARCRRDAKCICGSPRRRPATAASTGSTRRSGRSCSPAQMDVEAMRELHQRRQPGLHVDRRALPRAGRRRATPHSPQRCDACFTGDYPTR